MKLLQNDVIMLFHPKGSGTISCRMLEFVIHSHLRGALDRSKTESDRARLYMAYLAKRQTSSVRFFDPQARGGKVMVTDTRGSGVYISSSQCQINFFQWAADQGLFSYIEQNKTQISQEMSRHNRTKRLVRLQGGRTTTNNKNKFKMLKGKSPDQWLNDTKEEEEAVKCISLKGKKLSPPRGGNVFTLMGKVMHHL